MLLFANSIWQDTSEDLVIEKTLENVDYLISSTSFRKNGTYGIANYLEGDDAVESFDTAISTNIVLNKGNKSGDYRYFPIENQEDLDNPVSVVPTILYSMQSMKLLEHVLEIEGKYPTSPYEMMISSFTKSQVESVYNISISPGYRLNVSIAQRFPVTDQGESRLSHFELIDFENITISGIYSHNGAVSMTRTAFNEDVFDNSIIFPISDLTIDDEVIAQMDYNSLFRVFMITIKQDILISQGIDEIEHYLNIFANKIKSRFWFSLNYVEDKLLQNLRVEFNYSFNSSFIYYPLIFLSLLLTHFAIGLLIGDRETQISILRTKGATDLDITKLFFIEFIIIALFSLLISTPLAILFSLFIPSLDSNGINFQIVTDFYNSLSVNPSELYLTSLMMSTFLLVSFSYHVFRNIFYERLNLKFDIFKILFYILTFLLSILLLLQFRDISQYIDFNQVRFIPNLGSKLPEAILTLSVVWVLLSYVVADVLLYFLSRIYQYLNSPGSKILFFMKRTFQRNNLKSQILAFYVIFIFSLLIFSSSMYNTYQTFDDETDIYLQGGDYRIHTQRTDMSYTDKLEAFDGISSVTAIYQEDVFVGSLQFTIYAVDPAKYSEIGYWQYSNEPEKSKSSLNAIMDPSEANIIVSPFILEELNFRIYDTVNVIGLGGVYNSAFNLSDTIISAPGLGLANMRNPELQQDTTGWMLINIHYLQDNFDMDKIDTFLASGDHLVPEKEVLDNLYGEEEIIIVNPRPVNQNFVGVFISAYLPKPKILSFFVLIAVTLIGLIIISMITDYMLYERKQEFALMIATGGNRSLVSRFVMVESFSVAIASFLCSIIYGILLTRLSLLVYIPFTVRRIFVPLSFGLNWGYLLILSSIFFFSLFWIVKRSIKLAIPDNITDVLLRG